MIDAAIALVVAGFTGMQALREHAHGNGGWFAFYAMATLGAIGLAVAKARRVLARK